MCVLAYMFIPKSITTQIFRIKYRWKCTLKQSTTPSIGLPGTNIKILILVCWCCCGVCAVGWSGCVMGVSSGWARWVGVSRNGGVVTKCTECLVSAGRDQLWASISDGVVSKENDGRFFRAEAAFSKVALVRLSPGEDTPPQMVWCWGVLEGPQVVGQCRSFHFEGFI